jgi:hypothetical protein
MGSISLPRQEPSRFEQHVVRTLSNPKHELRNSHARTPHHLIQGTVTPNALAFTICHSGLPDIDPEKHRFVIHGMVKQPKIWSLADLDRYPKVTRMAFIECSGNSAPMFSNEPVQATCQALHGLVSNCEWTGVMLSTLLEEVGLDPAITSHIWDTEIYIGPVLYLVLVFLVIAGASNGVNLSDGLDGLAAGCCAIVLLAYTAITITNGQEGLAVLSACLVGASVGFLWFNAFPADIFMGDTGSLGLGGAIGGMAVMTQTELLLVVLGGIFVIEALSVALQVAAFKMFRRRILLMAPIHHHFELLAWSETKIMLRFWIVAAVCGGIGYTLYQNSIGT